MVESTGLSADEAAVPGIDGKTDLLRARDLRKRFGAIVAVDGLSLELRSGEIHAMIGPNGAGKTTAIAQLSGELTADSGSVWFAGQDVTGLGADTRARLGLARSFQITSLFRGFTAEDNVSMAIQAHAGHSFRFWRAARRDPVLRAPARALLESVGLGARADVRAGTLAHGEQRQLELAMALATRPKVLLLDEPMAGMGREESVRLITLLAELKGRVAILLVEHDMDAVFALADRISVLVYGRAVASGTPDAIRADPDVRAAYLGGAA
ncbi:MAG: ABC transporter ATP-binding protein [Rhodospirillales bacterium]|nr:MAG: ABC transporter ATP-binding protein [Rhodospirillales bacterium]